MTTNPYPQFTAVSIQLNTQPYRDALSKIANVYAETMRANAEQLWISSARIVQEESIKAFVAASQSCMEALAKNTAAVQQQALGRLVGAHQQAFEIMNQAVADMMSGGLQPAR